MSINNKGKFSIITDDNNGMDRATPVPSKEYDKSEKERHDKAYAKEIAAAPSFNEAASSGAIGHIDESGKFVEDEGRIILKDEYSEITIECMNSRHQNIVGKVVGSIMEYLSGQIQDFTSDVFIDANIIPKVLEFYEAKHIEVMDGIESGDDKHKIMTYSLRIPNGIFHEASLVKFADMIQEFVNGDKTGDEYLSYLKAIKVRMIEVGKHNGLLKEGKVIDVTDVIKV